MNLRVILMFSMFIILLRQIHVFPFQHKDTPDFDVMNMKYETDDYPKLFQIFH